jgi:hypothetical protein
MKHVLGWLLVGLLAFLLIRMPQPPKIPMEYTNAVFESSIAHVMTPPVGLPMGVSSIMQAARVNAVIEQNRVLELREKRVRIAWLSLLVSTFAIVAQLFRRIEPRLPNAREPRPERYFTVNHTLRLT